jgi:hypothetical protein
MTWLGLTPWYRRQRIHERENTAARAATLALMRGLGLAGIPARGQVIWEDMHRGGNIPAIGEISGSACFSNRESGTDPKGTVRL